MQMLSSVIQLKQFATYTLYGNFGSEVKVILNVTFDLQR